MNKLADASWSSISEKSFVADYEGLEHPVSVGAGAEIHRMTTLGRFSFVNIDTIVYRNVSIGRFTSIARNCEVGVASHPIKNLTTHSFQYTDAAFPNVPGYHDIKRVNHKEHASTLIGSDVWIGAQVIIKAGVTVGHGAVIGANSTIVSDVPPYAIVAGTPGKIVRMRFGAKEVADLLSTHWWDLQFEQIKRLPFEDVGQCLEILRILRDAESEFQEASE